MPTTSWCCAKATSPNRATIPPCWRATAGMRANGAISNSRQASMRPTDVDTAGARQLLLRAGAPERRHVLHGIAWLVVAAGLEALGPLAGKFLIDTYLLPRNADIP